MIIKKKITTLTTDANGRATYQYNSAGVGDVIFSANFKGDDGSLSSEIYVEDCTWYDDASIDKSSLYTKYNSPTFNYADGKYYIRKNSNGWGFITPMTTPITTNDDISIEVKFEYVGRFLGLGLYKSTSTYLPLTYYSQTTPPHVGMYGYGSTNNWIIAEENVNTSAPLTVKFDLKDNVINLSAYDDNGALVWSKSNITIPSTFNNSNLYLTIGNPDHSNSDNYAHFKNVKIKPL